MTAPNLVDICLPVVLKVGRLDHGIVTGGQYTDGSTRALNNTLGFPVALILS